MPPQEDKSALKRARASAGEDTEPKKPRRSSRLSGEPETRSDGVESLQPQNGLPSPVTHDCSAGSNDAADDTPASENGLPADVAQRATPELSPQQSSMRLAANGSSPSDTQPFSQFLPPPPYSYEVEDEEAEGVWGYILPLDGLSDVLVLHKRTACPMPDETLVQHPKKGPVPKKYLRNAEREFESRKTNAVPSGGYLFGRHPECDRIIDEPTVSNRHSLFFSENKDGAAIAVLEDLSANGTFVNDGIVGRNKRRELQDGDEISLSAAARFIFRYPRQRDTNAFRQHYSIQGMLGKGHFASVYLAIEKTTGMRYAVKKFEKRSGPGEKSKIDGLQQEIAVLMSVSHPNMLCLKDTFDEKDGVYLVLELASEGELFNWIVMKHKLSEEETRKVFVQLFQGVKYLHDRNVVHRDIKPENILLTDKDLHVKLADFGLAKIIGEESFTTTLCGTPSYVAPEILEQSNRRRYTRAVDVWSLGVVLYICLCGFPPFSDELCRPDNPYTLSQQIKMGRFDYPSPYWDSVGDQALDLIDRMLTVDDEKRITIDECLEHPWTTQRTFGVNDSTDGLTGALAGLDFSKRKPVRERTLLSSVNDVKVERIIDNQPDKDPVKVIDKNSRPHFDDDPDATASHGRGGRGQQAAPEGTHVETTVEPGPDASRDPHEFMEMGGKGDAVLFDENVSRYPAETMKAGAPAEAP